VATKIGFVGTGGIANAHLEALKQIEDVQIAACMDVDADKAAQAAARFSGAGAYTDVAAMLDENELDAVYVCVPPYAHGDIELALIERDIPFFVEKPIGCERQTPRRILEALQGKDLLTCVGYMFRYRANTARVKEHLAADEPVVARGAWIGGMPGVFWWRQKKMSGGQIMEQTTHVFDLARYLFGEVQSVFCRGRKGLITDVENYDVEDASICTLTFESGLVCEISSSCAAGQSEVSLEVFTRAARLKLFDWNLNLQVRTTDKTEEITSRENIFLVEDKVFIEAVRTGDRSAIRSTYQDAFKTQMVCCAANESMESGAPVTP